MTDAAGYSNYLTPLAETRATPGTQYGTFAIAPIAAGTIVVTFGGSEMNRHHFNTFPDERRSRSLQIELDSFLLGPAERQLGDAVNHSCEPNCGMGNATQLVAMQNISAGEEISFDYAMSDASNYDEFTCICGSSLCRGNITSHDWKLPELQQRYNGYFSPYIVRKIKAHEKAHQLRKSEAEELLRNYDSDPRSSLTKALRVTSGYSNSSFEILYSLLDLAAMGAHNEDDVVKYLNEMRVYPKSG
ncbi:MAG: SET domain-containing protein-lysine N-methyltransferase [Actinomycetes bacterium]